jgi:hypothetical protein
MEALRNPNRTRCKKNVVARYRDLLLCCDDFEGIADANWQWTRILCRTNVRARHGDELVWADHAEFVLGTSRLVLTGNPILRRGHSTLTGTSIVIDTEKDHARIKNPRGSMVQSAVAGDLSKLPSSIELRDTCPLASRPSLEGADSE